MKRYVIALTGLSGVGKSTSLKTAAKHVEFAYMSASTLIKNARDQYTVTSIEQDQLRHADLDENQRLLVKGFQNEVNDKSQLVVLDSHTLVERETNHILISPNVFEAIGISAMVFLHDDPERIGQRRAADTTRTRPARSTDEIHQIQEDALSQAKAICEKLGVELIRMSPGEGSILINYLDRSAARYKCAASFIRRWP